LTCGFGFRGHKCLKENLTFLGLFQELKCFQLNYGKNTSSLQQLMGEGRSFGYSIVFYIPREPYIQFAVTENNVRAVSAEILIPLYPGHVNRISLSRTTQKMLSKPFSDCVDELLSRCFTVLLQTG
jgi:hypothetical protein